MKDIADIEKLFYDLFGSPKEKNKGFNKKVAFLILSAEAIFMDHRLKKELANRHSKPDWYEILIESGKQYDYIHAGFSSYRKVMRENNRSRQCLIIHRQRRVFDWFLKFIPRKYTSFITSLSLFNIIVPSETLSQDFRKIQ